MNTIEIKKHYFYKKRLIAIMVLISAIAYNPDIKGQTFKNPSYKAKNAEGVEIVLVQKTQEYTRVRLKLMPGNNQSLYISSSTYIVNSNGGESLYIEKADGVYIIPGTEPKYSSETKTRKIMLDTPYYNIKPKLFWLDLYFPKTSPETDVINFRSGKNGNFWHFFEIDISTDIGRDGAVKSGRKGKEGACRFIVEPGYTAKSGDFKITKIEMCDTATILHFKVKVPLSYWFSVPSKTCIRNSMGGEDLFVRFAEGTDIDQRIWGDESNQGNFYYKLFFPPIDSTVRKIDFRELNGGNWSVYELDTDVP